MATETEVPPDVTEEAPPNPVAEMSRRVASERVAPKRRRAGPIKSDGPSPASVREPAAVGLDKPLVAGAISVPRSIADTSGEPRPNLQWYRRHTREITAGTAVMTCGVSTLSCSTLSSMAGWKLRCRWEVCGEERMKRNARRGMKPCFAHGHSHAPEAIAPAAKNDTQAPPKQPARTLRSICRCVR